MTRRINLWQGLALSAVLHVAVALPFVLGLPQPHKKENQRLMVELQGVISHHQQEEQKKAVEPSPPQREPPPPVAKPKPKPEKKKIVKHEMPVNPIEEQQVTPPPPSPAPMTREQQTVRVVDNRAVTARYVQALTKKLQKNIIYPSSAKLTGLNGTTLVNFVIMENGSIEDGSLHVVKSSGFPDLDQYALTTVRSTAPFSPPPMQLSINVPIYFEASN